MESGQAYDIELRQRGADSVYRWFHVQGLPVRDTEGRIIRWCILQTDIDERRRAEDALRESERELRQLIDSVWAADLRPSWPAAVESDYTCHRTASPAGCRIRPFTLSL